MYDLLVFLGASNRYVVKAYILNGEIAYFIYAKMNQLAGRYVGKDDPVLIRTLSEWITCSW